MLWKSLLGRVLAPLAVTGLLTAAVVGATAPSASALDLSPDPLTRLAPVAASLAAPAIDVALESGPPASSALTATPQRVVRGTRLQAQPQPWVLPVVGYHLTGRFGQSSGLWATTHTGLDFAAPDGTPIRSIGPGVVTGTLSDGAYGNKTVVRLDDGTVLWYCHQSAFAARPGQRVEPGDLIGYVGATGNTTGSHLHLEVHPGGGGPIDPEAWLPRHQLHP